MPEGGGGGLVDAGAGDDDVDGAAEVAGCGREERGERGPGRDVGFLEDGFSEPGGWGGVGGHEGLGFRAEGQVREEDVAAAGEEERGEGEVYAW